MTMLATIDDQTAQRVAADVRDHGAGYIRIDREGRAERVSPAAVVLAPAEERARDGRWVHE